jgi:hypothetical protein
MEKTMLTRLPSYSSTTRKNHPRRYRPRGRRIRNGKCVAAVRALYAADGYLNLRRYPTLAAAAVSHGSNINYVRGAIIILKSGDDGLQSRVLRGAQSLLRAAASVSNAVILVENFRKASGPEREMFGRMAGAAELFDTAVVTAL